ncbi:MAG: hypothetical protein ACTSU5_19890 [Promethearchaeota archaeon]
MYTSESSSKEFIVLESLEAPLLPDFDIIFENFQNWTSEKVERKSIIDSLFVPDQEFADDLQVSPVFWLEKLVQTQDIPVTFEINCDTRDSRVVSQDLMSAVKQGARSVVLYTSVENNFEKLYNLCSNLKDLEGVDLPVIPIGIHSPTLLHPGPYNPMDFLISGVDFVVIPEHYDPNVIIPAIQEFDHLGIIPLVEMGIFHDPRMFLWAEKHLDLGVTLDMYDRVATSEKTLEEAVNFALDFMHLIYDFGARGAILKLPMTPKRKEICEYMFPVLQGFLQGHAFSEHSI